MHAHRVAILSHIGMNDDEKVATAAVPASLSSTPARRKPQDILEEALRVASHQDGQSNNPVAAATDNAAATANSSVLLSLLDDQQQRRALALQQDQSSTQLRTLTNLAILGELQYLSDALLLSSTNARR